MAPKSGKIADEMIFKVFVSYSTGPDEQVIVWRLQTLAAASGIHVYVPHMSHRRPSHARGLPSNEVKRAIDESDCVLALITVSTSAEVESELRYALSRRKLVIPIVEDTVTLNPTFKFQRVFTFSRNQIPGATETAVVEFLNQQKLSKENQQMLGNLVAIGLGMLLLAAIAKE